MQEFDFLLELLFTLFGAAVLTLPIVSLLAQQDYLQA